MSSGIDDHRLTRQGFILSVSQALAIFPHEMNRTVFFEHLATAADPLAIRPEHESRMERLRCRLGDLRGKRVFEPGCGAGPLTKRLASWVGASGHILALDSSAGMVARCKQALTGFGHVRIIQANMDTVELERGAWDLILAFRFYPHLENKQGFLQQCARGLAPGGELVIANLEGSAELNAMHACLPGVDGDRMPAGNDLAAELQTVGWHVTDLTDVPDEFFLRARLG